MSSLTAYERRKLEEYFQMESGYVLDFKNHTFEDFFKDNFDIDIHSMKYQGNGTSKARKLREFWRIEPDPLVARVLDALMHHALYEVYQENSDLEKRCYQIVRRLSGCKPNLADIKAVAERHDAAYLSQQIKRMEAAVDTDPDLAIGTAKELIETICKTILMERGKLMKGTPDIAQLTKETLKELKLVPEGVREAGRGTDVVKRILQNLGAIGNGLAELRGLYGTGHGDHSNAKGLRPRHAKLAVGAAATLATFLFETHGDTK